MGYSNKKSKIKTIMQRYSLYNWPNSQEFVGRNDCILIDPEGDTCQGSSYLVPVTDEEQFKDSDYVEVEWTDMQTLENDPSMAFESLHNNTGRLFITVKKLNEINKSKEITSTATRLVESLSVSDAIAFAKTAIRKAKEAVRDEILHLMDEEYITEIDTEDDNDTPAIGPADEEYVLKKIHIDRFKGQRIIRCECSNDHERQDFNLTSLDIFDVEEVRKSAYNNLYTSKF